MGSPTAETALTLGLVAQEVGDLRDLFQRRLLNDRLQKQLYDELYKQLELANSQLSLQVISPLLRQIVLVIDRIESTATADGVVESIRQELLELLTRYGVARLQSVGQIFDPRLHQAVGAVGIVSPEGDGVVTREFRAGYLIEDRVLRPAEVEVGCLDAGALVSE
jgi:molecular chaperone GrpE